MAKIGDIEYRTPKTDEWTNAAYLLMILAPLGFWPTWVITPAAVAVCLGSWYWHRFENVLSRRFDELGMMMTVSAIASVVAARATSSELCLLAAPPVWAFYYFYLHRTSSFHHIAYWSVPILTATAYLSGWDVLLPIGLTVFGLFGQFSFPWNGTRYEHGPRHGLLWHLPVALALFSVLWITA